MTEADEMPDDFDDRPSKSQRKRDMIALQALGEKLVELSPEALARLPLDDHLRDTILEAQKMAQREARRRHIQLIGKLMRVAEVEAIQSAYEAMQDGSRVANRILQELEYWRARLLQEGDSAVGDAMKQFPGVESQVLRQLIRDARREADNQKAPAASRRLFQYLKSNQVTPDS